jgi:hypothetical protein
MQFMKEILPVCPVCEVEINENREFCRRCGCHLLLLAKIKKEEEVTRDAGNVR